LPKIGEEDERKDYRPKEIVDREERRKAKEEEAKLVKYHSDPWIRCFKLPSKERNLATGKLPEYITKDGEYVDGIISSNPPGRAEVEFEHPFKLFHRPLKKTDKNMIIGDMFKSKM
jgi:hypothetical protein